MSASKTCRFALHGGTEEPGALRSANVVPARRGQGGSTATYFDSFLSLSLLKVFNSFRNPTMDFCSLFQDATPRAPTEYGPYLSVPLTSLLAVTGFFWAQSLVIRPLGGRPPRFFFFFYIRTWRFPGCVPLRSTCNI